MLLLMMRCLLQATGQVCVLPLLMAWMAHYAALLVGTCIYVAVVRAPLSQRLIHHSSHCH